MFYPHLSPAISHPPTVAGAPVPIVFLYQSTATSYSRTQSSLSMICVHDEDVVSRGRDWWDSRMKGRMLIREQQWKNAQ